MTQCASEYRRLQRTEQGVLSRFVNCLYKIGYCISVCQTERECSNVAQRLPSPEETCYVLTNFGTSTRESCPPARSLLRAFGLVARDCMEFSRRSADVS